MTKLFKFCATLLAFLVAAVAAAPQEHLAPAAHQEASKVLAARAVENTSINYHADKTGLPVARVQARQVHNADYGSNNGGPSGNPQPSHKSGDSESSSKAADDNSDSGAPSRSDDSTKENTRRAFTP